jgi:hypothetical protein
VPNTQPTGVRLSFTAMSICSSRTGTMARGSVGLGAGLLTAA